jgi:hypothetical protein
MGKPSVPEAPAAAAVGDVAMVLDRTEDAQGYRVLRRRGTDDQIELGTMRPLQEGRPIDGEVISLEPREDMPFLYNVKTELADPRAALREQRRLTSDGPAQIATEQYRQGWDAIWGQGSDKPN